MDGGFDCPSDSEEEEEPCDMPACAWTDWGAWGGCSGGECGLDGSKTRTRDCIPAVTSVPITEHMHVPLVRTPRSFWM